MARNKGRYRGPCYRQSVSYRDGHYFYKWHHFYLPNDGSQDCTHEMQRLIDTGGMVTLPTGRFAVNTIALRPSISLKGQHGTVDSL